ncbi:MAG TPA: hypothetical protein VF885_26355 [Arthrobacter sp.]
MLWDSAIRRTGVVLAGIALATPASAAAQQFNSDNYWVSPHGTITTLLVAGTSYSTIMTVVALWPKWELNAAGFLSYTDQESGASSHWSTILYAKREVWENDAKNGGLAFAGGIGTNPGYQQQDQLSDPFRSFFATAQLSLPLFKGKLLWDLNPGVTLNTMYGDETTTKAGLTYSTRMAWYGVVPKSAIVGEVFGTAGGAYAPIQYRAGLRWEPSYTFVGAVSWAQGFNGSKSGGLEVGIMIFSPPFACLKGCPKDRPE